MSHGVTDKVSIPLKDIWFVLWNKKHKIMLITLFCVVLSLSIAGLISLQNRAHPRYITSSAIAVISENQSGNFSGNSDNPSYEDVSLAQKMADSVIYIATSDKVLDEVTEKLDLKQTQIDELKSSLTLEQYEESQIIRISLTWYDPDEGVKILTALTEVLPDILIESLKIGNAEIVDFPRAAVMEPGVNILLMGAISLVIGLVIGVIFYVLKLVFRATFLSGEDLEDTLELPLLGEITVDKNLRIMNPYELVTIGERILSGQFIEQSAFCAHILKNEMDEKEQKTIFVTSSVANEGKTTFSAVIAWQLALQQKKILLIDLDTRKPCLGRYFFRVLDKEKTVNAVAKKWVSVQDACVDINEYLTVLPGYLEKSRMRIDNELIDALMSVVDDYDYVIIDSSPVGLVSDVMRLKKLSGCAIMVVEQGKAWQGLVADCANRLEKSGIAILGTVLNKVNVKTPANRYYYRNYGNDSYYTGDDTKKKVRKESKHKKAEYEKKAKKGSKRAKSRKEAERATTDYEMSFAKGRD